MQSVLRLALLGSLSLASGSEFASAVETAACEVPVPIEATHTKITYPPISQRMGERGPTHLTVTIGADGSMTDVTISKSSSSKRLDDAAVSHIKAHYRWQPLAESCNSAAVKTAIVVHWILDHPPSHITPFVMKDADFPPGALERGEQGTAILTFRVDDGGAATDVRVTGSSSYAELDARTAAIFKDRIGAKLFDPWPAQYPSIQPYRTEYGAAIWSLPASAMASLKRRGIEIIEVHAPAIVLRAYDGPPPVKRP